VIVRAPVADGTRPLVVVPTGAVCISVAVAIGLEVAFPAKFTFNHNFCAELLAEKQKKNTVM